MPSLRLQARLCCDVLRCGRKRIWLDPNETSEIATANSRADIRKLHKDGLIMKKPVQIHSRTRVHKLHEAKRKGRHTGYGKRRGTREARMPQKTLWIRRMRVLRRLLRKYREQKKVDKKLYHRLYMKVKGNEFRNKRNLMEHIHKEKSKKTKEKQLTEQMAAKKLKSEAKRDRLQRKEGKRREKERAAHHAAVQERQDKPEKAPKAEKSKEKAKAKTEKKEKPATQEKAAAPEKQTKAEKPAAKAEKPAAKADKKEKKDKGKE